MKLIEVDLGRYHVRSRPDFRRLGGLVEAAIVANFPGANIAIRGISLTDHPGKSLNELCQIIQACGTDRYDPDRVGTFADVYRPFGVDLHAVACTVGDRVTSAHYEETMAGFLDDFYGGALHDRGYPLRIDLILVYNRKLLRPIIVHSGDTCEFAFRDPENKIEALIGLLRLA